MKQKKSKSIANVYEASDPDEDEKKILMHRQRGGGSVGRSLDQVDSLEFQINDISPEDDEEIDEDCAFNESDEEKYGSFFSKKKKISSNASQSDSDGEGEEDSEYSEDEGDMVDLSEMIQGDTHLSNLLPTKKSVSIENEWNSDMQDSELESQEEFQGMEDENAHENMLSLVQGIGKRPKKRKIQEINEAFDESEFAMPSKLLNNQQEPYQRSNQMHEMFEAMGDEAGFGGLKKKLLSLEKESKKISNAISAPLPKRIQDRYDRQAAYIESKKEISKWVPMVKKMRESDNLSFPINVTPPLNMTNGAMVSQFTPESSLELEISKLLDESGLSEKKLKETEELELNKLDKNELLARQSELSKMRSLLFYKEQKQKKIAKIKSKIYRKLKRKEKKKNEPSLEELKSLDPESAREKMEQLELDRAKERVTLKHKSTGKWAKLMLSRKDGDPETRKALLAQLDKHQELKKRIMGVPEEEDSELEESQDELESLEKLEQDLKLDATSNESGSGLFAMKFMKKAVESSKHATLEMIQETRRELERGDDDDDDDQEEVEKEVNDSSAMQGRRKFQVSPSSSSDEEDDEFTSEQRNNLQELNSVNITSSGFLTIPDPSLHPIFKVDSFDLNEEKENVFEGSVNGSVNDLETSKLKNDISNISKEETNHIVQELQVVKQVEQVYHEKEESHELESDNPWLNADSESQPLQKSLKSTHYSHSNEKSFAKFIKQKNELMKSDGEDVSLVDVVGLENQELNEKEEDEQDEQDKDQETLDYSSSSDSQDSEFETNLIKDIHSLSKKDIMKMTFENDDLVADFESDKRKIIEAEMPKEVDETLPGWGSWGGHGAPRIPSSKKIIQSITGIQESLRKDSQLKHVVINERRHKKSSQYLVPNVPHGFENRDQYERIIRTPIGKEWNTQEFYKDNVKPRISTKLGTVIAPLKFVSSHSKKKKNKTK